MTTMMRKKPSYKRGDVILSRFPDSNLRLRNRSLIMNSDSYITIFSSMVPLWFGIFALFFFVIGLRGILTKRPFLISNRWLLSVIFIALVPAILIPVFLQGSDYPFIIKWLNPMIFTVLLVMMCFALRGYVAYAVTDTSFREALLCIFTEVRITL